MNVLLTCVGRRNYLVASFRQALQGRGLVYGADSDPYAPALQACDKAFTVSPIDDSRYGDEILALCREHRVRLLVPLLDLELPIIAPIRDQFSAQGTVALVSSPAVVELCFDKWKTLRFLADCNLEHPASYLELAAVREALRKGEVQFPLVIKPRWGSASLGLEYSHDDQELEMAVALLKKKLPRTFLRCASMTDPCRSVLIQQQLHGEEYGLDVVNDLCGRYVTTFVRRKLRMRAGETDQAVTVDSDELEALGRIIGQRLGHVGSLDCDLFVSDDGFRVLELNPRFGGGYPFSHIAGANVPAMLLAWASGTPVDANWAKVTPNVVGAKYEGLIVTQN
jgi:carbamoyl-phosphate synthase large subunit